MASFRPGLEPAILVSQAIRALRSSMYVKERARHGVKGGVMRVKGESNKHERKLSPRAMCTVANPPKILVPGAKCALSRTARVRGSPVVRRKAGRRRKSGGRRAQKMATGIDTRLTYYRSLMRQQSDQKPRRTCSDLVKPISSMRQHKHHTCLRMFWHSKMARSFPHAIIFAIRNNRVVCA